MIEVPQAPAEAAQNRMYLANRILAHSGLSITGGDSGLSPAKLEFDYGSAIEVLQGSLSFNEDGDFELKGDLIANTGNVTVAATGDLTIRSQIRAGGTASITAGETLVLAAGSRVNAGSDLLLSAENDVRVMAVVGGVLAPQNLQIDSAAGRIYVDAVSGRLKSAAKVLLAAPQIEFAGELTTTGATTATDDTEIRLLASEFLRLSGTFTVAGSVLLDSPQSPELQDFTGRQSGISSTWTIQTAGELKFGGVLAGDDGKVTVKPVRIQAVKSLIAAAAGRMIVPSGSQLAVSGDDSQLVLRGTQTDIVGSLYGGATWGTDGALTWSGRRAGIHVEGTEITVGGPGPDASGLLVTRGGTLQATGEIRLVATGAIETAQIDVNGSSALRALPEAADALAVASASSRVLLDADGRIRIYGLVEARGMGGDVDLSSDSTILLDGMVRTADQLAVTSRVTTGTGVELTQLLLKSDAAGRLLIIRTA
jgi:hypothetical protein